MSGNGLADRRCMSGQGVEEGHWLGRGYLYGFLHRALRGLPTMSVMLVMVMLPTLSRRGWSWNLLYISG